MNPVSTTPLCSMTGFGSGGAEVNGTRARVEIRTVNHRGLKLSLRSRTGLGVYEKKLRDQLASALKRGAIDVNISLQRLSENGAGKVQEALARSTISALKKLADDLDIAADISARDLLLIPDLFTAEQENISEDEWSIIATAMREAITQVIQMRTEEGSATADCLQESLTAIAEFVAQATAHAPKVIDKVREKLTARIAELRRNGLHDLDRQAIEREICIFADRADIQEELDRLDSHIGQFRTLLKRGGEAGKRMEFLAQEFLREINTCASKANAVDITARAVDAKLAVEKIKEQAANIE